MGYTKMANRECLIMVVTHGGGKIGNNKDEIKSSLVDSAYQQLVDIVKDYDKVNIGFDGDPNDTPPAVIATELFSNFGKGGGKLIQSQGIYPSYGLPSTAGYYNIDKEDFLTLCYRDKGSRAKGEGFPDHADFLVDIKTGVNEELYGGTDMNGNLAGSTAAWNMLAPVFLDENADVFLLVIWDEEKAQLETKKDKITGEIIKKPGRGFKGSITEKTLQAVENKVFTMNGKDIIPLVHFHKLEPARDG